MLIRSGALGTVLVGLYGIMRMDSKRNERGTEENGGNLDSTLTIQWMILNFSKNADNFSVGHEWMVLSFSKNVDSRWQLKEEPFDSGQWQ